MSDNQVRSTGVIIAFPDPRARSRASLGEAEPRGEILLFTGVRYERLESNPGPSRVSDGQSRRRRRRS